MSRILARFMGSMKGVVARVMAQAVEHVMCLCSTCGHHARGHGTHQGMSIGTCHVSWLSSWAPCKGLWHVLWHEKWDMSHVLAWPVAPCKGPWHASWHERWHASCVLAQPVEPCKGPWHLSWHKKWYASPTWLDPWHYTRARGTCHGTSGDMCHVSWLAL